MPLGKIPSFIKYIDNLSYQAIKDEWYKYKKIRREMINYNLDVKVIEE